MKNIQVNDIPAAWRHALAAVQVAYPDALLAGGCLRDRDHGVKVKDLDIFVSVTTTGSEPVLRALRAAGWKDPQLNGDETYKGETARQIAAVVDLQFPGAPPIQLIAMRVPVETIVPEFDWGICQIVFDGKKLTRTAAYYRDSAARQFRLIPKLTDARFIRSLERWARLKEKYPDWKLHLGSRAEDVSGGGIDVSSHLSETHYGVTSRDRAVTLAHFYQHNDYKDLMTAVLTGPCELKVPRQIADRLTRELKHSFRTGTSHDEAMVHIDGRDTVPATRILQDILEAKQQLHRDMTLRGMSYVR